MRFALVVLFVIALMAYVGWHLWTLPPLPAWARWLIVALQALGFAMFCIAMSPLLDRMPMPVASLIYNVGTRSLMVMLYLLMAFLLADLLRLVHLLPAAWLRDSLPASLALLGLMAAIFVYGRIHYEHKQPVSLDLDSGGRLDQPLKLLAVSNLQISGHTHRGQLWPISWVTDALYECSWGTLSKGQTTVCVTSGLGIWGAKYRIGTQSEYLLVNLR